MAVAQEAPRFRIKHDGPNPVKPGVAESLVEQGRTPLLDEVFEGDRRVFYCWVPSPDTRRGDFTGWFAGTRFFKSSAGELRSQPDMFVLSSSQASRLEERIRDAKENKSLPA